MRRKLRLRPPRLRLERVRPLIDHLDSLPDNSQERELDWAEDERAIEILKTLCPEDHAELGQCVKDFTHPDNHDIRTLVQWYGMARHLAYHLEVVGD